MGFVQMLAIVQTVAIEKLELEHVVNFIECCLVSPTASAKMLITVIASSSRCKMTLIIQRKSWNGLKVICTGTEHHGRSLISTSGQHTELLPGGWRLLRPPSNKHMFSDAA